MACWDGKDVDELTPQCFTALGKALHRGPWLNDLEEHARDHGTDTTWKIDNPWAYAAADTYLSDFPTDPDGPYAELLEMAGLRDEDDDDDVGDSGEASK